MLSPLDWGIIAAYLLLSLGIGLYFTRRAGRSSADFFLGGRSLPWWLAGLSLVATTFAADTPLAVTELVRQGGVSANWLWWCALSGGMLTTFFFARLWRRSGVLTEVELVAIRYSGAPARFLRGFKAVYFGLIFNCVILGWVNLAMLTILKVYLGMDDSTAFLALAGVMLLTAVYSSLSGLLGVAYTDAVQFVIAMAGCIVLAVLVLQAPQVGGLAGLKTQLGPTGALNFFPKLGDGQTGSTVLQLTGLAFATFLFVQWWASWYPGAEPGGGGYVAQRIMSAKNEGHALAATLFFQVMHYAARPWPWILVGLCTAILYPQLTSAEQWREGYVMAMKDFLPSGWAGLMLAGFLAAYMSTIATQLNWGTSYLVNDLYKPSLNPAATPRQEVGAARIITLALMALSLAATTQLISIEGAWKFVMNCGAGTGLVLILRWYWWRISAWTEIVAMAAPFIIYGAQYLLLGQSGRPELVAWFDQWSYLATVAGTTLCWLAAAFILPGTTPATLQSFWQQVQPGGWWAFPGRQALQGQPAPATPMGVLAICWLAGIAFAYSLLFGIGSLLFLEPDQAATWGIVAAGSAAWLWYAARRWPIFS